MTSQNIKTKFKEIAAKQQEAERLLVTDRTASLQHSHHLFQELDPETVISAFNNSSKRKQLDSLFRNHLYGSFELEHEPRKRKQISH